MVISAVLCSRNDNYGGNLAMRATHCLNSMANSFDEVWYIDWNSPTSSLLYDILPNVEKTGKLHHIVIDGDTAAMMTNYDPDAQKCCEALARNIGIRRATGDWIVSTNIDIVAPKREDLVKSVEELNPNCFFTLSRRSGDENIAAKYEPKKWSELRDYYYATVGPRDYKEAINSGDKYSLINCCGDFQLAHKKVWNDIRGFEESMIYSLYTDTNVQLKAVKHGFSISPLYSPPIYHINHGRGGGGFIEGINRRANDGHKYISSFDKTENPETWGFSDVEIEHEVF